MSDLGPEQPPQVNVDAGKRIAPLPLRENDGFAACPKCQHAQATKVGFTWWGGAVGPRIFHVVKCGQCGTQFNGKTGGTLTAIIVVYQAAAVALGVIAYLVLRH